MLLILLAGAVVWAGVPLQDRLEPFNIDELFVTTDGRANITDEQSMTITSSMFDADLWYTPPVAAIPKPSKTEPQSVPTQYQLMAITQQVVDGQQLHFAVLYDPKEDLVHRVALGDPLGAFVVSDITNAEVTMQQGQRITVLRLDDSEPQS
ncbi:MAG TPA: hypothetical protein DF699_11415 [Phycisphaerales bacterium]|nr:hypothetical protein [Phycisphaerales bacterium]